MKDKMEEVKKIANNTLYFDDNHDYCSALWDILYVATPELCNQDLKLKYIEDAPKNSIQEATCNQ